MAFTNGIFARLYSWVSDRDGGIKIRADRMDAEMDGFKDAFNAITGGTVQHVGGMKGYDGTVSAPGYTFFSDDNSGFYRIGADNIAVSLGGVKHADFSTTGTAILPKSAPTSSGTDTITLTWPIVASALASEQTIRFKAGGTNTGAATLNLNSLGAKAVRKMADGADVALSARDIIAGKRYTAVYDSTANGAAGAWILLDPSLDGRFAAGHLFGCTLSNNGSDATNDIDIAVGSARDSTDVENIVLSSALTKQLDAAWAVGTNQGMRATGAVIANTTYFIFLIKRPDTGVVDIAADTSATGANIAANTNVAYTLRRRIGAILRESGAIVAFVQDGDVFRRSTSITDIAATNPGTSAVTRTLSVPVGIRVQVFGYSTLNTTTTGTAFATLITDLSATDDTPSTGPADIAFSTLSTAGTYRGAGSFSVLSNTSGQVRSRISASDANTTYRITTAGWIDTRGRVA